MFAGSCIYIYECVLFYALDDVLIYPCSCSHNHSSTIDGDGLVVVLHVWWGNGLCCLRSSLAAVYMGATEWSQKHYDIPVCQCVRVRMCMHAYECVRMQMCVLIRIRINYTIMWFIPVCVCLCDCVCMGA